MKAGMLKDIKIGENRVIATPVEVASLIADGHEVLVQKGAGVKAGFADEKYAEAGAVMVDTAEEIYGTCDFVAKVKEFEPSEYGLLREGQIVFTCIHPAAHPEEVPALLDQKVIAFTAEDSHRYGSPNCEAAGKQGALMGLDSMLTIHGGKGKFVSGLGAAPGMKVLILGGGVVGQAALAVLHALGAWVTVADINIGTLRSLQNQYRQNINTMISNRENIRQILPETDMVLNCVKWPKGNTQYLITRDGETMERDLSLWISAMMSRGLWRPSMRPRMRIRGMWKKGWYTTVSATFRGQLPILRPLPMRHPCFRIFAAS